MKKTDEILKKMFDSEQSKLPSHERVAGPGEEMCLEQDGGFKCTRARHAEGDHVSCGMLGDVHHRWATNVAQDESHPYQCGACKRWGDARHVARFDDVLLCAACVQAMEEAQDKLEGTI